MKKSFLALAAFLLCAPALAQPGPGPGPQPDPWTLNGSQVYYSNGCISISATPPGPCHGAGSLTTDNLFVTGAITGSVSSVTTPFTVGATSVTTTGTQFNYINAATGTTGSGSTSIVFSGSPTISTPTISGHPTIEGVTSTGATGTGNIVFSAAPTFSGTVTLGTALSVANGGTGAGTLTGVIKGNGTSAFTAATAGTDFVAPGTQTTFTARQNFSGGTSFLSASLVNAAEPSTVSATAATGTINYDVCTQSVIYFTTNASGNWTDNFRCSSGTTLNAAMGSNETVTVVRMVTQGGTAFFNNAVTIDGSAVTPKWQGGTAPSAGNINGIDIYTYAIIKTATNTYTVLASQTQFK